MSTTHACGILMHAHPSTSRCFTVSACMMDRDSHLAGACIKTSSAKACTVVGAMSKDRCLNAAGHLDVVGALLEANPSSVTSRCEGSPPLHMAACLAALPSRAAFAVEATKLLLSHGASMRERWLPLRCLQ